VKVVAVDQETLKEAQKILSVLFSQVYQMGPSWCYFHAESVTVNIFLEFREYKGRVPKQMNQKGTKMFEVCSRPQVIVPNRCMTDIVGYQVLPFSFSGQCTKQASDEASVDMPDTSLNDLEMLNPKQSPLDSWDELHSALDSLYGETTEGKIPTEEIAKKLPIGSHMRARS